MTNEAIKPAELDRIYKLVVEEIYSDVGRAKLDAGKEVGVDEEALRIIVRVVATALRRTAHVEQGGEPVAWAYWMEGHPRDLAHIQLTERKPSNQRYADARPLMFADTHPAPVAPALSDNPTATVGQLDLADKPTPATGSIGDYTEIMGLVIQYAGAFNGGTIREMSEVWVKLKAAIDARTPAGNTSQVAVVPMRDDTFTVIPQNMEAYQMSIREPDVENDLFREAFNLAIKDEGFATPNSPKDTDAYMLAHDYFKDGWEAAIRCLAAPPPPAAVAPTPDSAVLNDPDKTVYLIVFDDTEQASEMVIGGTRARYRFMQISGSWNAHLFVKVQSNSRDDPHYNANLQAPAPDAGVRDDRTVSMDDANTYCLIARNAALEDAARVCKAMQGTMGVEASNFAGRVAAAILALKSQSPALHVALSDAEIMEIEADCIDRFGVVKPIKFARAIIARISGKDTK